MADPRLFVLSADDTAALVDLLRTRGLQMSGAVADVHARMERFLAGGGALETIQQPFDFSAHGHASSSERPSEHWDASHRYSAYDELRLGEEPPQQNWSWSQSFPGTPSGLTYPEPRYSLGHESQPDPAPQQAYALSYPYHLLPTAPQHEQQEQLYPVERPVSSASSAPERTHASTGRAGSALRRVCFNCEATSSAAWRRSALVPGKPLCNRCGLYERTHMRPRPSTTGTVPRRRSPPHARGEGPPFYEGSGGAAEDDELPMGCLGSRPYPDASPPDAF